MQKKMNEEFSQQLSTLSSRDRPARHRLLREWWTTSHRLLVDCGTTFESLYDCYRYIKWRKGVSELFTFCEEHEIPFIIVSAGLTDAIKGSILHLLGRMPKNVLVIANKLFFNEEGKAFAWDKKIIHSENKKKHLRKYYPHLISPQKRVAVIFGDSKHDAGILGDCLLDQVKVCLHPEEEVPGFYVMTKARTFITAATVIPRLLGLDWAEVAFAEDQHQAIDREGILKEFVEEHVRELARKEEDDSHQVSAPNSPQPHSEKSNSEDDSSDYDSSEEDIAGSVNGQPEANGGDGDGREDDDEEEEDMEPAENDSHDVPAGERREHGSSRNEQSSSEDSSSDDDSSSSSDSEGDEQLGGAGRREEEPREEIQDQREEAREIDSSDSEETEEDTSDDEEDGSKKISPGMQNGEPEDDAEDPLPQYADGDRERVREEDGFTGSQAERHGNEEVEDRDREEDVPPEVDDDHNEEKDLQQGGEIAEEDGDLNEPAQKKKK